MKVLICGAGKVGLSIASYLEKTNHDIIIIDQSEELVRNLSERYDIRAICGYATDPKVMQQAGAEDAAMLIAVTHFDEVNMIACEMAHAVFNVPTKIARVRNQAYLSPEWIQIFEEKNLGIDVTISPEIEVAETIRRGLSVPGAFSITPMVGGRVRIIGVKCTSKTPIVNTPITHVNSLFPQAKFTVAAIFRDEKLLIPESTDRLLVDDDIYFVCSREDVADAMRAFGHFQHTTRRVLILGAGNIGASLAYKIDKMSDFEVRIVEKSQERAEVVARQLENSEVLVGDALAIEVLREAGVESVETVVAVTEDDKVNTLASLLAKQSGAQRALALIGNPETIPLVKSLGVDSIINPREITVSSILRHVRQGYIESVYTMRDYVAEILEALVTDQSSLPGATIEEINIPGQIKLLALVRDNEVIMPSPKTTFQLDDRLIIIAKRESVQEVERMFAARMDYF